VRLFDAHCHLEDPSFDDDREEVITRAVRTGVLRMVTSPLGRDQVLRSLKIFSKNEHVLISAGMDSREFANRSKASELISLVREVGDRLVAIGEVGLDYKVARTEAERTAQKEVFREFIRLADSMNKPLVVHSRWAQRPVLRVLDELYAVDVVLHSFGGNETDVKFAAEREWFMSVPTSVTYSANTRKVARLVPDDLLLLETDSPVMSPHRHGRNEPANLVISVIEVASIRGVNAEELADLTFSNSCRAYKVIF